MSDDPTLFDLSTVERVQPRAAMPVPRDAAVQARNFHGWTLEKLTLFELYLKQYRRVAGSGTFIDAFAGDGNALIDGVVRPGSARVALASKAFKYCRFYEKDPATAARLEQLIGDQCSERVHSRTSVVCDDSNVAILRDLGTGLVDRERPCFALLDPNSTELSWATVEALASYKTFNPGTDPKHPKQCKIELWILFNTHQALMRLVPRQLPAGFATSGSAATLDRVMGDRDAWNDLVSGSEPFTYGRLVRRYVERLQQLEYQLVRPCQILDPRTGRPQYYMVHASDHPAAHSLMYWAQKEQRASTGKTTSMFTEGQLE